MVRVKRLLGKETIEFIDGEEKEVELFAVSNFEMMRLKRLHRVTQVDRTGKGFDKVEFHDDEFILSVLDLAVGSQLTKEDLKETETPLDEIYRKYFKKDTEEKKDKSSDMSEPNQAQN